MYNTLVRFVRGIVMRADALTMTLLYDYYGELLTEKQRGLFDLYYNQDYSLSEIASAAGISRQGVHDTLARAEELLEGYEAALGCIARDRRLGIRARMRSHSNAQALAFRSARLRRRPARSCAPCGK